MTSIRLQTSLLLSIFLINWAASASLNPEGYYIKHVESGLVLDAVNWAETRALVITDLRPKVNNQKEQLWIVEPLIPGMFQFKNAAYQGLVLDAETGTKDGVRAIAYKEKPWNQGGNQRFFINDNGVITVDKQKPEDPHLYLTAQIETGGNSYCNFLPYTGESNQIFAFEPVS